MDNMNWPAFFKLSPERAIDFLRKKGNKTSFNFYDIQREEHAYNFTVAKAMSKDILQDIRAAVDKALNDGTTLETFKKELRPLLVKKGWWGKQAMVDPNTGEEKIVQLGSPRRLQIIFDTNLRTSYAAGHWEGIQKSKRLRPYLRYVAVLDERTREQHRHWHDTVKPVDDPFWDLHYPPNGWRCRCSVQQLSERDLQKRGLEVTKGSPDGAPVTYIDKRTGDSLLLPPGIDPSFAYNPGKSRIKSLTPPALDLPLSIPYVGEIAKAPPPSPRAIHESRLLPDGLAAEDYVRQFLKEFGGDIGKPVLFKDVTGEYLLISEELFKSPSGKWKVFKRGRHRHLLLLADAIKEPDEIFHVWQEYPKGRMSLLRHYLVQWQGIEGGGFTLFDTSKTGWSGITSFNVDKDEYLKKQRVGALVYRRTP